MNLVLTIDYELFGNGSGNVFEHMINPTHSILSLCKEHKIKTTIFFEVLEYIKLKNEWESGNRMGYFKDPIKAIEIQLQNALREGHDIQLHVHPQWINAKYHNNSWEVDFLNWRLGSFQSNNYSIKDLLLEGKTVIENLLKPINPEYQCIILRAGGYNIQPSKNVILAMKEIGLKVDSSVYPNGYENGLLSKYDYRDVSIDLDYWWTDEKDVTRECYDKRNDTILEIPIFALLCRRWKKVSYERIRSAFMNKESAIHSIGSKIETKNLKDKINYFFEKEAFTWDFCLFNSRLHNYYFSYIDKNLKSKRSHFVLIGHPKNFTSKSNFTSFINSSLQKNYLFKTLIEIYNENYN